MGPSVDPTTGVKLANVGVFYRNTRLGGDFEGTRGRNELGGGPELLHICRQAARRFAGGRNADYLCSGEKPACGYPRFQFRFHWKRPMQIH